MDDVDRFKPQDQINEIAELIRSLTYGETVELASKLQKAGVGTKQLDKVADLIRALTYGEMIDFATGLWKAAADAEITGETLPVILHRWASEQDRPQTPGTALMTPDLQRS